MHSTALQLLPLYLCHPASWFSKQNREQMICCVIDHIMHIISSDVRFPYPYDHYTLSSGVELYPLDTDHLLLRGFDYFPLLKVDCCICFPSVSMSSISSPI